MLLLLSALASAPAPETPATQEIVVTAKRDKCFVAYAQHQVSTQELDTLSRSWALGTPVRVIEPRRASIKCEFQIMQYLSRHGAHMAQFVSRSEDLDDAPGDKASASPPSAPASAETAFTNPTVVQAIPVAPLPAKLRPRRSAPVGAGSSRIISLTCRMEQPGAPYELDVEVNEDKGTATPSRPDTGGGSEMKAVFMPGIVRFGPFTLSRTTLRIQQLNAGNASQIAKEPAVIDGQCGFAQVQRAF